MALPNDKIIKKIHEQVCFPLHIREAFMMTRLGHATLLVHVSQLGKLNSKRQLIWLIET